MLLSNGFSHKIKMMMGGICLVAAPALAQDLVGVLGGVGVGASSGGAVVRVNPDTAAVTVLGIPVPGDSLTGIAALPDGRVLASTAPGNLIEINPTSGALIATVGVFTDGNTSFIFHDLAADPTTGDLFGVSIGIQRQTGSGAGSSSTGGHGNSGPFDTNALFRIDPDTAVVTYVGTIAPAPTFVSIEFAADGTLFGKPATSADLYTLDPTTAAIQSTTSLSIPVGTIGLGTLPNGEILMAECCASGNGPIGIGNTLYRFDPATGTTTQIGNAGSDHRIHGLTALAGPAPGPAVVEVPTLDQVGLLALFASLALAGIWLLLRR